MLEIFRFTKKLTMRQPPLTLFLRVELTSSVSFSKSSASLKHLYVQTQFDQVTFFSNALMLVNRLVRRELLIYPMLGSRPCCSWKLSSANMAAWICSGAWWVNLNNIMKKNNHFNSNKKQDIENEGCDTLQCCQVLIKAQFTCSEYELHYIVELNL